ncbi:MAG TPA: hypothetical protein VNU68_35960 [Verrucomicrobiae bacterium]|nr:hypothetical protein [Verrucomicrobiae bacterium]
MQSSKLKRATGTTAAACIIFQFLSFPSGQAEISEPDNLLYGTIVIGTNPVTPARSDVVVEARRTPTGPAVATYRMGSNPGLGAFYALHIPVEASTPVANTNASLPGDTLYIVLCDASGVEGQATYTIPERGVVQRVNFGVAVVDSDGNGLPDAWEIAWFGKTGQNPNADPDHDGRSNLQEWITGTNPLDANEAFSVSIQQTAGQIQVAFVALRAEGAGYDGMTRRYSFQSSTNLASGLWSGVAGFTNVIGNNQPLTYQFPATSAERPVFYRGSVRLE